MSRVCIRDEVSGDHHRLPRTTQAIYFGRHAPCEADGDETQALSLPPDYARDVTTLGALQPGDWCYVRTDDVDDEDGESLLWWLSQVTTAAMRRQKQVA